MKMVYIKNKRIGPIVFFVLFIFFAACLFLSLFSVEDKKMEEKKTGLLSEYLKDNHWSIRIGTFEEVLNIVAEKKLNKYDHIATIINANYLDGNLKMERIGELDNVFIGTYFNDKKLYIESNYVKSLSPYPEVITNSIECPEEFKPKLTEYESEEMKLLAYDFLTNDRFTYGVCSDDLTTHKAQSISVYCIKSKELYNMELSVPINGSENNLNMKYDAISCTGK